MELYVNSEKHLIDALDPGMTLLRYLRTVAKLKGTKEGCASGDCGACTVLVADGGQLLSVNSCIALLGSFAGKRIYTVDGLANPGTGELHPVQKAMVDCHGSQCGFCTPGFVMSLAGLYENNLEKGSVEGGAVFDAISGNLCRCTGYRPIIEAAETMLSYEPKISLVADEDDLSNGEEISGEGAAHHFDASDPITETSDISPEYYLPTSEQELQSLFTSDAEVFLVAGGTDKVLEISQNYSAPARVIDVTRVEVLNAIDVTDTHIDIGAAVSYSELEKVFSERSPEFIALLHRLGSRQIRNRGTLGGNIANGSPIADTPPVLFVWQAEIEVVNSQGERRWVDVNEFYIGYRETVLEPDAYIARIRINKQEWERPHRFYKVSKRFEDDISAVMGAFVVEQDDGICTNLRAAYGGMAATPVRASKTEAFLIGKEINSANLEQACAILQQEFKPLSDVRASAAYRSAMAVNLFRKAVSDLGDLSVSLPKSAVELGGASHA